MLIELARCTETLLNEINDKKSTRKGVAKTYLLAMRSSEAVDWRMVNNAIIDRWSLNALEYIKTLVWSGKAFST